MHIVQRHADHRFCHDTVVVEYGSVKARIACRVLHDHGLSGLGDDALDPQPVFHRDVGNVGGTDMEQRAETVCLGIKKPNCAGFAVQRIYDSLQAARQSVFQLVNFEQLLHDLPGCFCKSLFFRHDRNLPV